MRGLQTMKKAYILKNEKGFTLIEILFSIILIGIIAIGFTAGFGMLLKSRYFNQSHISASNVAKTIMEEVRYDVIRGKYDDIGTVGGAVDGKRLQFTDNYYQGGRRFQVTTNIWWEDETVGGTQIHSDAYKRIEVTVQEIDIQGSYKAPPVTISTLVADEKRRTSGEPEQSGTIVVEAKRRFNLQPNVFFRLSAGSTVKQGITDSEGKLIFARLKPGNYMVTAVPEHNNIMLEPISIIGNFPHIDWRYNPTRTVSIEEYEREVVEFEVDWPAFLNINLKNGDGSFLDFKDYSGGLDLTIEVKENSFFIARNHRIFNHAQLDPLGKIKLWPRYTYNIILEDKDYPGRKYDMLESDSDWDGTFPDSDSPQTKNVDLIVNGIVRAQTTPGEVAVGTRVLLTTQPEGFEIYYTTDGTRPDFNSKKYNPNNPPTVPPGGLYIRAFAYREGYLPGPVYNFIYQTPYLP